ncbi:restriction endonuclease BglII [Haloferax mucosum ATCC BAA-1512]|uniref:Restriction endonuclease BglII n=2 Tax=Haloferax mucosum TaxID=403181 RepID=M0IK74_9EURY|nr:restriction endonuclease BglII [Haloferax mucosum ATCC BAA-1512]
MRVTDIFSFGGGLETLQSDYRDEYDELVKAIESNTADEVFVKRTKEASKSGKFLASPGTMNHNILIEQLHDTYGWAVDHSAGRNKSEIEEIGKEPRSIGDPECEVDISPGERYGKRTVDGWKNSCCVEIQFGKYAFMIYDVLAKFGHFQQHDKIGLGIEVLPSNNLVQDMSTGVGYYEQLEAEISHLPTDYVNEEYRIPVVGIGVGFERPSIDHNNLEAEVGVTSQQTVADF